MEKAKRTESIIFDGGDWICSLPEPIVHQFLSRLPPNEVIRTSVLSKTMLSAVDSFPVIDLDRSWFCPDRSVEDNVVNGEFVNYMNYRIQRLKLHKAPLQKFRLRAQIADIKHAAEIKKAISFALENGVKVLNIDLVSPRYSLPLDIIRSATSLVTLCLAGLKLSNLNGSDISSCWPLLEDLSVDNCSGLREFNLSSSRIRSVVLRPRDGILKKVMIQSQSLLKFEFAKSYSSDYSSKCDVDICECPFLNILSLSYVPLADNWVENNVPIFVHLNDLQLYCVPYVYVRVLSNENLRKIVLLGIDRKLEIRAPNLESLSVDGTNIEDVVFYPCVPLKQVSCKSYMIKIDYFQEYLSYVDGLRSLGMEFDFYCRLKRFEINCDKSGRSGSSSHVDEMVNINIRLPFLGSYKFSHSHLHNYIKISKGQLLDVTLSIGSESPLDNDYFVAFWNWIASFGRVKVLTLSCSSILDMVCSKNLTVDSLSPIYDLKCLTVKLLCWRDISPELVNRFLWQSPNLEVLRFVSTGGEERLVQIEYGIRTGLEDESTCCECLSMKCWRHSVTQLVLKNFNDVEGDKLVKYFLDNAPSLRVKVDRRHQR